MSTKQLYEKTSEGMKEVSPLVAIEDIYSKLSDTPLEALVSLYNHVKCEWKGSVADTRRTIPLFLRRSGLFITYNNGTKYITEFFSAGNDQITTEGWVKDSNWTPVPDEDYISAGVKPGVGTIGYEQLNDNLKQLFREKVNVTNFPDDEDITSVDNMLKLKDREVDDANFQSKGYVILRKNLCLVNGVVKNILTQNMINTTNTIYEIRYDFDLNGATINIPENSILKFEGGSLQNFFNLKGNNTKIITIKNSHIFYFNRYEGYIDGTWEVDYWNIKWFGAVNDAYAKRAKYVNNVLIEDNSGYDTIFYGTDNYMYIQEACDTAYNTNSRKVLIPIGRYRICTPIQVGWKEYNNVSIFGEDNPMFGAAYEANNNNCVIMCDTDEYGICINAGYRNIMSNFSIVGYNNMMYYHFISAWQNNNYELIDETSYNTDRVNKTIKDKGLNPTSPYAGIITDVFMYDRDEGTRNTQYTFPKPAINQKPFTDNYRPNNSTSIIFSNVVVKGFTLGIGYEIGYYSDNADFYKMYNCTISSCVYGLELGSNQARLSTINDTSIIDCYCAISNCHFGIKNGNSGGKISSCCFDCNYSILDYKTDIGSIYFSNCYGENTQMITLPNNNLDTYPNIYFLNCTFHLTNRESNPLGIPKYHLYGGCKMTNTEIVIGNTQCKAIGFNDTKPLTPFMVISMKPFYLDDINVLNCNKIVNAGLLLNNYSVGNINHIKTRYNYKSFYGDSFLNNVQCAVLSDGSLLYRNDVRNNKLAINIKNGISYNNQHNVIIFETDSNDLIVGNGIFSNNTIFVVVKNTNKTIYAYPLSGYKYVNNQYVLDCNLNSISYFENYTFDSLPLLSPLVIKSVNDDTITLYNWDDNLSNAKSISANYLRIDSLKCFSSINSVSKENKTITFNNNVTDFNNYNNKIYAITVNPLDYWVDTLMIDIINWFKNNEI